MLEVDKLIIIERLKPGNIGRTKTTFLNEGLKFSDLNAYREKT